MNRIAIKSLVGGFVLGSLLFAIAPLGLGIYAIEAIKPLLVPGLIITQSIAGGSTGTLTLSLALILNGLLFTLPFLCYFTVRERAKP